MSEPTDSLEEARQRIPFHLIAPREPRLATCTHGRPDHIDMIRQLAEAMGIGLGAVNATPEQVWAGLLDEVERRFRSSVRPS